MRKDKNNSQTTQQTHKKVVKKMASKNSPRLPKRLESWESKNDARLYGEWLIHQEVLSSHAKFLLSKGDYLVVKPFDFFKCCDNNNFRTGNVLSLRKFLIYLCASVCKCVQVCCIAKIVLVWFSLSMFVWTKKCALLKSWMGGGVVGRGWAV